MRPIDSHIARVAARLRRVRQHRGESTAVAREVRSRYGVKLDPSYLSKMERGEAEIPMRTFFALAEYYEIDPRELIKLEAGEARAVPHTIFANTRLRSELAYLNERLGDELMLEVMDWFLQVVTRLTDRFAPDRPGPAESGRD